MPSEVPGEIVIVYAAMAFSGFIVGVALTSIVWWIS
jgi:hypothetical protein